MWSQLIGISVQLFAILRFQQIFLFLFEEISKYYFQIECVVETTPYNKVTNLRFTAAHTHTRWLVVSQDRMRVTS